MLFASLPVLMYHSISRFNDGLSVSPEKFEEHCSALSQEGWRGISLAEAEEYFLRKRALPKKVCLFTFDDGYLDNYIYADPLLRRYGHNGVLFPVMMHLRAGKQLHQTVETLDPDPDFHKVFARLDRRKTMARSALPVRELIFCNRLEVRRMHLKGNIASAPHSLRHDRVVRSLSFTRLYNQTKPGGFFGVPPYAVPWGFPYFDLGHFLSDRKYEINPKLFELIENIVPQEKKEARAFLKSEENKKRVFREVAALGDLGRLETETEYRARIYQEFEACRDLFTKWFGTAPISFCWPWGTYNKIALQEARKAGFRIFFTVSRGINWPGGTSSVHRIKVTNWSGKKLLRVLRLASNPVLEGWARFSSLFE